MNYSIIQLIRSCYNTPCWLASKENVLYDATDHFVLILKVYDYKLEFDTSKKMYTLCDLIDLTCDSKQILYEEPIFYEQIRLIE